MQHIEFTTCITAPIERCFDLSCDIDVHTQSMSSSRERAVAGVTSGLIGLGEEVTWEAWHFGIRWRFTSRIIEFARPGRFVDEMQRGPFGSFRHEHRFEQKDDITTMIDVVDYQVPLGPLGSAIDVVIVRRYLRHLLEVRNRFIKESAEALLR